MAQTLFMNSTQMPATERRVTIKDVALQAGVQHASVSVVLNGAKSNTHVSPAARERILQAAQQLGYKRNSAVEAMKGGRFGCVALLLSTEQKRSNVPQPLWNGIHDELAANNLNLMMARLPDRSLSEESVVPKLLREWMADGMLIDYTNHIPPRFLELIRGHNTPAIWINSKQEWDCVRPDDFEAGVRLTNYLIELGHRRIVYADFLYFPDDPNEHYSSTDRKNGYQSAMDAAGLEARIAYGAGVPHAERAARFEQLLSETQRPTALISYGDIELNAALAAAVKLGLNVPRDLSLASFLPTGTRVLGLEFTTCAVPEYLLGQRAVASLLQKISAPSLKLAPQVLPFDFSPGQSSVPPSF